MNQGTEPAEAAEPKAHKAHPAGKVGKFFANLGPGLITGAADDDPSGISTYSVTGAAFGYVPLWTALFSFPLMVAVQLMCARLGLVTGRGLAGVVRRKFSPWVLWGACLLLIVANVFNIGADLGGMADATEMMTGINSRVWTPIYAGLIVALDFVGFNAVKMLFYSAVLNGVLAPPLIVLVTLLTSDPEVMGERVSSPLLRGLGWATATIMAAAAIGMFVTSL